MTTIFILLLAAVAMVFMTRSSRKRQKEAMSFRDNLAVGQEVMTGSGYFGTIVAVEADTITLETTPGNTSRWLRAAIAKLVDPPADAVVVEGSAIEGVTAVDAKDERAFDIPEDISSLIDKKTDENGK
jgi:preprotein translocase subunit YajC